MDQTIITTIAAMFGVGGGGFIFVRGLLRWITGRSARQRAALQTERKDTVKALADVTLLREERNKLSDYAARLRRLSYERGVTPPDWPEGVEGS